VKKLKKLKNFLKAAGVAAGAGLYLLEHSDRLAPRVRSKISGSLDDLRGRAKDAYDDISDRVSNVRFRRADHSGLWNAVRFAAGIGVGIGIGLLFAPYEGEETRSRIADRAQELGDNVRQRFSQERERFNAQPGYPATGTGD